MSSSPRRRLGDRNTAAIAQDRTVATPPAPKEPESQGVTPEPETKTKATTTAKGASAKAAQVSDTVRLGIYITPEDVDSAKSAYLADWQAGATSTRSRSGWPTRSTPTQVAACPSGHDWRGLAAAQRPAPDRLDPS